MSKFVLLCQSSYFYVKVCFTWKIGHCHSIIFLSVEVAELDNEPLQKLMVAFQFCGAPRKFLKLVSAFRFCSASLKINKEGKRGS